MSTKISAYLCLKFQSNILNDVLFSTKCSARKSRVPGGCKVFQLSANSPLPPQKTVSENKKKLIQIIVETLIVEAVVPGRSRLIITGQEDTLVETAPDGVVIRREDLKTIHEEADTIIVAQAIYAAKIEGKHVVVVADDTDVYILLLYHYHAESLKIPMKLQSTQTERAVTATVLKLSDIIPQLLPAHGLSGCDTVPMCYGIGKGKMLKVVNGRPKSIVSTCWARTMQTWKKSPSKQRPSCASLSVMAWQVQQQ